MGALIRITRTGFVHNWSVFGLISAHICENEGDKFCCRKRENLCILMSGDGAESLYL